MSSNEYTQDLRDTILKKVVDDLVREKSSGAQGQEQRKSYDAKLTSLAAMGMPFTRDALYKRVNCQFKNLHDGDTNVPVDEV